MLKPYWTNIQYFIKEKSWMLVAWWISDVGEERHWDYEYVWTREQWEKLLDRLKSVLYSNKKHNED